LSNVGSKAFLYSPFSGVPVEHDLLALQLALAGRALVLVLSLAHHRDLHRDGDVVAELVEAAAQLLRRSVAVATYSSVTTTFWELVIVISISGFVGRVLALMRSSCSGA